jgi:hypothetical protein
VPLKPFLEGGAWAALLALFLALLALGVIFLAQVADVPPALTADGIALLLLPREKNEADRKADTRRKIIIGGIWLKYFPECKDLNPADEKNFGGVARAIAALAGDEQFLQLWMKVKAASEIAPAGQ